jgi:hypothetical protein
MRYVMNSQKSLCLRLTTAAETCSTRRCSATLLASWSIALQRTESFFSILSAGVMHSREAKDTPYLPKIMAGIDRQRRDCVSTHDERNASEGDEMKETQEAPDYTAMVREEMTVMEAKRGLVAAELEACEAEIVHTFGAGPGYDRSGRCGALTLDAVLGDEEAASELEVLTTRRAYLEGRASLCRDAIAYADERLEALRRPWLTGHQAAHMDLSEIPEVLRERVRLAREQRQEGV